MDVHACVCAWTCVCVRVQHNLWLKAEISADISIRLGRVRKETSWKREEAKMEGGRVKQGEHLSGHIHVKL